jgi:hypothetical protein
MSRVTSRPRTAIAALGVAALILAGPAAASAAKAGAGELGFLFGLTTAPDGSLLVADASQGIVAIDTKGNRTLFAALPGATDVSTVGAGNAYAITGGGPPGTGAASLYRISKGEISLVADLGAFEATVNPDAPEVNPNPFDVEVLNGGGVLVADAGGNDVLYVDNKGRVDWVVTLPTELESTANAKDLAGCPDVSNPEFAFVCELPDLIPTQPVATAVTIGPDGAAYVSELKGFPGPLGASRIWRIEPGTIHAACGTDPGCEVVGDGFTSIVDLNFGPDGTLYVTEIDESSFLAVELGFGGSGGTVNACAWGSFPLSCSVVATGLPIPTATTIGKDGTLYTTIWSLVPGQADVVPLP